MLQWPHTAIEEAASQIDASFFHEPRHRIIFDLLVQLRNNGNGIDLITFTQALRDRNLLESVGGASYITELQDFAPSGELLGHYLGIVHEKWSRRKIILGVEALKQAAYREDEDVSTLLAQLKANADEMGRLDLAGKQAEPDEPELKKPRRHWPIEAMPPILANAARAISLLCKVPVDLAAAMVNAVVGMACGPGLRVRSGSDRTTLANQYWIVGKISGTGGSKAYEKVMEPFDAYQQILRKEFDEKLEPLRVAKLTSVKARIKAIERTLAKEKNAAKREESEVELTELNRQKAQLEKIKSPTIYVTDVTREALIDLMAANGSVLAHADPEAGGALDLIIGERYQGTSDKENNSAESVWLAAYSGDRICLGRKGTGGEPHKVEKPCLTCLFVVVPRYLEGLFARRRLSTGGLLPRMLVYVSSALPQREDVDVLDETPAPEILQAREDFRVFFNAILAICMRYHRFKVTRHRSDDELALPAPLFPEYENVEPFTVSMEPGAQRLRKEDRNRFCDLCEESGDPDRPYESRHTENAIKIALAFHAATYFGEGPDGQLIACAHKHDLTEETMRCALIVRDFCNVDQYEMRQPQVEKAEDKMRETVIALMQKHPVTGVTARDCARSSRICRNADEVNKVFEALVREEIVEPIRRGRPTKEGGGQTTAYKLANRYRR
jgi:hypothetical protein